MRSARARDPISGAAGPPPPPSRKEIGEDESFGGEVMQKLAWIEPTDTMGGNIWKTAGGFAPDLSLALDHSAGEL